MLRFRAAAACVVAAAVLLGQGAVQGQYYGREGGSRLFDDADLYGCDNKDGKTYVKF